MCEAASKVIPNHDQSEDNFFTFGTEMKLYIMNKAHYRFFAGLCILCEIGVPIENFKSKWL